MNDLSTYVIAPITFGTTKTISRKVKVKDRKEAIKCAKAFYGNKKVSIIKI